MAPGETGLIEAIHSFMKQIEDGTIDIEATEHGLFSFLLTKKQQAQIQKICNEQDWVNPQERGVTLTREFFNHVLVQRKNKDRVTAEECAAVLASAYSTKSQISVNKKRYEGDIEREQQALIFRADKTIGYGSISSLYGVAVIEISLKEISPITAYHARGDKIKAFGR